MFGTTTGNILAILYFTYFQMAGMIIMSILLRKESPLTRLLIGSVTGSLMLQWIPVLFAFFFDFGLLSHVLAAIVLLPVFAWGIGKRTILGKQILSCPGRIRHHAIFLLALTGLFVLWAYLLHTHTIPLGADGAMYAGQCTYGDMNMHLGFITSIANQGTFPPDYSLFPGTKLSYPFLNDSISSSLYLLGASLRLAYILPMLAAFVQVVGSVYLLAITILGSRAKALLTNILFFLNGGLGFAYFFDWSRNGEYNLKSIFTGFYTTPTNLVDHNIRWVNIIADMLLPQRATLFGYAVLFPCIWLLYRAVFQSKKQYFLMAGIFASALPMIHTHSFLGLGLISAAWLLLYLYRGAISTDNVLADSNRVAATNKKIPLATASKQYKWYGAWGLFIFVLIMCLLQKLNNTGRLTSDDFMAFGLVGIGCLVIYGVILLIRYTLQHGWKNLLQTWGVYLLCVLILAVPQLLFWTFGQVAEGGFLRGHFNWGNQGDFYLWFYLKNMGLPLLLIVGAICAGRRKSTPLILPAAIIWFVIELIVFTPNTYDNNKLLYIAYLLLCLAAADYGVELYYQIRHISGMRLYTGAVLLFSVLSAILTLGREVVSEYTLYSTSQVELAKYIEENTDTTDVILTNTRHNNEVASLTGRSIVCGADTFLYFHGINTSERKEEVRLMYEAPLENLDLFEKYSVDYVVISSWERNSYAIDERIFAEQFELVFSCDGVKLYEVLNGENIKN